MSRNSWILLISLIVWVVSYNIWQFTVPNVYYVGTAQLILVCSYLIHKQTEGIHHVISRIFVFLAANSLLDELLFDPTQFEWNEFFMLLVFISMSLWKRTSHSSNG
jgi:hypothetical protein